MLPPQNATGNWVKVVQRIPVRISVACREGDPPLRVGMSATIDIDTGHSRGHGCLAASKPASLRQRPAGERSRPATQDAPRSSAATAALITVVVMMATIMQALDGTIANVALPNMQGTLSATQDQVAWVITSYIVPAAIATPLAGFLRRALRRAAHVPDASVDRLHDRLDAVRRRHIARRSSCSSAPCRASSAPRWCRCRKR